MGRTLHGQALHHSRTHTMILERPWLPNLLRRLEPPMLPRCLTRNRSPLEPMRALVRKAPQSMPTSNCVDRCDFELCPYPPKGLRRFWDEMGARARDRTPKRLLTAHTATDD
jgi:hypothetical protein